MTETSLLHNHHHRDCFFFPTLYCQIFSHECINSRRLGDSKKLFSPDHNGDKKKSRTAQRALAAWWNERRWCEVIALHDKSISRNLANIDVLCLQEKHRMVSARKAFSAAWLKTSRVWCNDEQTMINDGKSETFDTNARDKNMQRESQEKAIERRKEH